MNRRDTDLSARRDHPWSTRARGATDRPAVRVLARRGGGRRRRHTAGGRGCLTQGGELEGRADGPPQQLAQRALGGGPAVDRRGEHVFGKLRIGADGTVAPRRTRVPNGGAARNRLQRILRGGRRRPRARRARPAGRPAEVPGRAERARRVGPAGRPPEVPGRERARQAAGRPAEVPGRAERARQGGPASGRRRPTGAPSAAEGTRPALWAGSGCGLAAASASRARTRCRPWCGPSRSPRR